MRSSLVVLAAVLAAVGPAAAQAKGGAGVVQLYNDPDTGEVIATTQGWAPVKASTGYSVSAQKQLVLWVEAAVGADGTKRVMLVGEKARYVTPKETRGSQTYGPSDPDEPVYVGSPFMAADLRHRGAKTICWDDAHWCALVWDLEIRVPAATLDAFLRDTKAKDLRVALDKRRKVEWRVPRAEIEAALRALDGPAAEGR